MNHYASYVRCIRVSLMEKGVTAADLREFLLSLSAFEHNHSDLEYKLFSSKQSLLEEANDVETIFGVLFGTTPFLNL